MGRPSKQTVEYFPHYVHHGKTLFILEQKWGVHGYAAFYKLLEVLGNEPGHYYDARKTDRWEFICAKMGVSAPEILQKLSDLEIIDVELWSHRVVWMESFVESVKEVYRKRDGRVPGRPPLSQFLPPETGENPDIRAGNPPEGESDGVSGAGNPRSRVEEVKKAKKREKSIGDKPPTSTRFIPPTLEEVEAYCRERNKGVNPKKWFDHYTSNGWKVGKNKMVDWKAAVRTWEEDQGGTNGRGNNGRGGTGQFGAQAGKAPGGESEYPVDLEETIGDY